MNPQKHEKICLNDIKKIYNMEFTLKHHFNTSAQSIYNAWLNSEAHSLMTGGDAQINPIEGEDFRAWDDYISGKNIELKAHSFIKQSWRTVEFNDSEEDSLLEIQLNEKDGGTELILTHSNLPAHGQQYHQGWIDNYFIPMTNYFNTI